MGVAAAFSFFGGFLFGGGFFLGGSLFLSRGLLFGGGFFAAIHYIIPRVFQLEWPEAKVRHLNDKVQALREEMARLKQWEEQRQAQPDGQLSLTDPDSRSMKSNGRGSGTVGYNVQTAVEAKHHLIVAHEVTNTGTDHDQLCPMSQRARSACSAT